MILYAYCNQQLYSTITTRYRQNNNPLTKRYLVHVKDKTLHDTRDKTIIERHHRTQLTIDTMPLLITASSQENEDDGTVSTSAKPTQPTTTSTNANPNTQHQPTQPPTQATYKSALLSWANKISTTAKATPPQHSPNPIFQ